MTRRFFLLCFALGAVLWLWGFAWPVKDETDPNHPQPSVHAVYCDWTEGFLHSAIDIPSKGKAPTGGAEVGTAVLSAFTELGGGEAEIVAIRPDPWVAEKGSILVVCYDRTWIADCWGYGHVRYTLEKGTLVSEGESIATINHYDAWGPSGPGYNWEDHLHLRRETPPPYSNAMDNPLLYFPAEEPKYYRDPGNHKPFIWDDNPESKRVGYRRQEDGFLGLNKWAYEPGTVENHAPQIDGEVDIIVMAQDYMNARFAQGQGQCTTGVYKLAFWIEGPTENSSLGSKDNPLVLEEFEGLHPGTDQAFRYYSSISKSHKAYYLMTNLDGNIFKCWSTKADHNETGIDAGEEKWADNALLAKFPDDIYNVYIKAWDANGNSNEDSLTQAVLENYYPMVESYGPEGCTRYPALPTFTAVFTEDMDPSSITDGGFSLLRVSEEGEYGIGGVTSYNEEARRMTFVPNIPLPGGSLKAIVHGSVRDLDNKNLDGDGDGAGHPADDFVWYHLATEKEVYAVDHIRDWGNVAVFNEEGDYCTCIGGAYPDEWLGAITVDQEGNIYVACTNDEFGQGFYNIVKLNHNGSRVDESNEIGGISYLATDNYNIYALLNVDGPRNNMVAAVSCSDLDLMWGYWSPYYTEPGGIACSGLTIIMPGYDPEDEDPPYSVYLAGYNWRSDPIWSHFMGEPAWLRQVAADQLYTYVARSEGSVGHRIEGWYFTNPPVPVCTIPLDDYPHRNFVVDETYVWVAGGVYFGEPRSDCYINVFDKYSGSFEFRFGGYGEYWEPDLFSDLFQIAVWSPHWYPGLAASPDTGTAPEVLSYLRMASIPGFRPIAFALVQNIPNPFKATTAIPYQIPHSCHVYLSIYNAVGQLVRVLVDGDCGVGVYTVVWDGKDERGDLVPRGTYICRMTTPEFSAEKKLVFLR